MWDVMTAVLAGLGAWVVLTAITVTIVRLTFRYIDKHKEDDPMPDRPAQTWACPFCLTPHNSPDFPIPCEDCPKETP